MIDQWWWCERCNTHYFGDKKCPVCFDEIEVRSTMSKEEAKARGLTE